MSQLIIENLTKTIGDKTLFQHINFTITEGEKVGLIGINGTGKSTLLSILAGKEDADQLMKEHPNAYRIAYLEQEPSFNPELTVLETVFSSDAPIVELNLRYEHIVQALSADPTNEEIQQQFSNLQNEMDRADGWDMNAKARTILTKLGVTSFDKKMKELSGGQQKRVCLANVLLEPAQLLLLDEPTNHLDVASIEWLQDYLANEKGAVLFITHDRYFLDAVATHIYELANTTLYAHTGNYADFIETKALRVEMAAATEQKLRNRYRTELQWIRRGAKARSTKQKARIERFENLSEQLQTTSEQQQMDVQLQTSRLGKKVIELVNVGKNFGSQVIVQNFSMLLQTGDRIAIVGPNGVGKTTLLRMIAKELEPDTGEIEQGSTVKIAHFHQHIPEMNEQKRMIEYIREISNDIVDAEGTRLSATQMLERFLFPSSTHGTIISKLSGGERKRLYLLKLLMEQPNVLLLDEPTNDLDIETLSVLESFIDTFPGVVITISHDRFFLDRTATKLWELDGTGTVTVSFGTYSEYVASRKAEEQPIVEEKRSRAPEREKKKKMTYSEKQEWETIEAHIEQLEQSIETVEHEMTEAGADYDKLQQLTEQLDALNTEYEQKIERWSYLEELAQMS